MKKINLNLLFTIICLLLFQLNQAQILGKWVVPAETERAIYELTFTENEILDNTLTPVPVWPPGEHLAFSAGGYNGNYETNFYVIDNLLCYGNTNTNWIGTSFNLYPDYQLIRKPQSVNEYYTFFSHYVHHEASSLSWNTMTYNDASGIATASEETILREYDYGFAGFAITDEQNNQRFLYTATRDEDGVPLDGSLRKWTISSTGISYETEIINQNNSPLNDEDFEAYNLELTINDNNETVIAWINGVTSEGADRIIVVIIGDGAPQVDIYNLNEGAIGGIEFSSLEDEDNMLYASCADKGIVKVNYTTGAVVETIVTGDYAHTYLQTAPDGHIYGVSNNGYHLGKIDMQDGSFTSNIFSFLYAGTYNSIATYFETDGVKYYILPENERVHNPMSVTLETTAETCPGYADGTATICVTGGTPGVPPDDDRYTIVCTGPGGEVSVAIDDDEDCFYLTELQAGPYTYTITDGIGGTIDGVFVIDAYSYSAMVDINEEYVEWNNVNESYGEGIKILSDNTLTINNSVLEFGPEAKIIIEPGAKLIVNNTVLTNLNCVPEHKWLGVEVRGNKEDNQSVYYGHPLAQGKLALTNSTIEHAKLAVLLAARDENDNIIWSTTGGIVTARNSHFINNTKSLYALYYQNTYPDYPGYEIDNFSFFKNTTFTINSSYIIEDGEDHIFHKHIDLNHVKGFNFEGCDFLNTATENVDNENYGIKALDAGFSVEGLCTSYTYPCPEEDYDRCNLSGFYSAIWASSDGSTTNTFSIDHSNFTDNAIGVKASSVDNAAIIYSDFNIGYNSNLSAFEKCGKAISYGVDMIGCTGFAIEENDFTTTQSSGEQIGVRILESNTVFDLIYRNSYNNLTEANRAEGDNRDDSDDDNGLEYQCNINTNNAVDFIVSGGQDPEIKTAQGDNNLASGNTFTDDVNAMHFINNGTQTINYFWCDLNDCDYQEPLYYNTDIFFQPIDVSTSNSCPSHYGGGAGDERGLVLTPEQKLETEQEFVSGLNDYNNVRALYDNLKDGGNTTSELLDIATAQPDDLWELRSQLLGHSPYLSHEVLKEAADKTDVLPDGVLFEILSANPDELRNTDLIEYLENKEEPLPAYMISILQQMAGGITAKTVLKMEMGSYYAAKTMAAYDIIRSILNDSTYDAVDLRGWLGNLQSYNADRQIISSWLMEGNTADAVNLLNMLPTLYELEGDELEAHNDYTQMTGLQVVLQNEGRNIMQLNSNELDELADLAENGLGTARRSASNILQYAYGHQYYDCPCDNDTTTKSAHIKFPLNMVADALQIEAYPSPAGTWVTFDYVLPLNETEALITISDVNGKTIKRISLSAARGQKVVDVRNIHNGIWFYTMHSGNQTKSGKLVIQH